MRRGGPRGYDRGVNPDQGLYWPSRRNLFRRRPSTGAKLALWAASAFVLCAATAAGCLHAP
jgi:hypothetical protein